MDNIKDQKPVDKDSKKHGEWIDYYDNGQLSYRNNWFHGILHGLQEGYGSDGRLRYRGYYNMGIRVGYWYLYLQKHYYLCLI